MDNVWGSSADDSLTGKRVQPWQDDSDIFEKRSSRPYAWKDQALCAQTDPEAFYPEKGGSTREAKKICGSCEVRKQCLQSALDNDERYGIWGGHSERERRRLKISNEKN